MPQNQPAIDRSDHSGDADGSGGQVALPPRVRPRTALTDRHAVLRSPRSVAHLVDAATLRADSLWAALRPDEVASLASRLHRPSAGEGEIPLATLPQLREPVESFSPAVSGAIGEVEGDDALIALFRVLNEEDDAGHQIAQRHEGMPVFDTIHAVIHRRECDFGNARYWARQIETQPFFGRLARLVAGSKPIIAAGDAAGKKAAATVESARANDWSPLAFVAVYEEAARGGDAAMERFCRVVTHLELSLLTAAVVDRNFDASASDIVDEIVQ